MISQILKRCLVVSVLLLTGCSAITELRLDMADKLFGREPLDAPIELQAIAATNAVQLNWSSQLGGTDRYDYTPVLSAGFVYLANAKGELAKLNADNGKQEWRVDANESISGGVGSGGGLILVGTSRGNVLAYDVNGKQVWKSQVSSEVLSAPRYFEGKVIVRSGDNHIYGLDATDGVRKWVYTRKVPALSLRSSAGIVVDGGAVYAGFSGGKMIALNADSGQLLWEATVATPKGVTEIERIADITSLPVVAGSVVYAVAYQGRIAAVDRRSGNVIWNREISSYTGMASADDRLYVSHTLGSLYSLDYSTGRTFWRQGDLLNRRLTTPLVIKDFIAVGDVEGYVHFINLENGKFAARIKAGSESMMSLIAGNSPSQLIAATRNGGLYAVSIEGAAVSSPIDSRQSVSPTDLDEEKEGKSTGSEEAELTGSESVEEPSRSILFQNQKPSLFPESQEGDSGPGITLPKSQ
jgi:outer membrane protein assembly factor BamB